jgi:hypothetical protein
MFYKYKYIKSLSEVLKIQVYHDLNIFIKSSIYILQIGHLSRFLLHRIHAALCLQGIYSVSRSFS